MSNHPRPILLGYIRADLLRSLAELPRVEAQLADFAAQEEFSLGTVYVEKGTPPGAFQTLMAEVARDEANWGVLVPDLRHVTVVEELVLTRHDNGTRTPVLVANFAPRSDGPGAGSPTRVRPVFPPARHASNDEASIGGE
jgi:hypothetical protein